MLPGGFESCSGKKTGVDKAFKPFCILIGHGLSIKLFENSQIRRRVSSEWGSGYLVINHPLIGSSIH